MGISEQTQDENHGFWENSNKYSWSNIEISFLKELSFIMTYLHKEDSKDQ
jgi:hypothetical protein